MGKSNRKRIRPKPKLQEADEPIRVRINRNHDGFQFLSDPVVVDGSSFPAKQKDMISRILSATNDGPHTLPESGIWSVYIRRVHAFFMAETNQDGSKSWFTTHRESTRKGATNRDWWVSFVITPTNQEDGKVMKPIHISGIAHDRQSSCMHPRDYNITPTMVVAVLHHAMEVVKTRPIGLHFWPGNNGAFRMKSVHRLISAFEQEQILPQDFDLYAMELQDPPPEIENSATCYVDPRTGKEARNHNQIIEANLSNFEQKIWKMLDVKRGTEIMALHESCITKTSISQLNLRKLFKVSRMFHDICSGQTAPALDHWITLRMSVDPCHDTNESSCNIVHPKEWAVVVQSGKDISPAIYFMTDPHGKIEEATTLQFQSQYTTSLLLLDHVLELGLELGSDCSNIYPILFRVVGTADEVKKGFREQRNQRLVPKVEDIPSICCCIMAITKLAANPTYSDFATFKQSKHHYSKDITIKVDSSTSDDEPMKPVPVRIAFMYYKEKAKNAGVDNRQTRSEYEHKHETNEDIALSDEDADQGISQELNSNSFIAGKTHEEVLQSISFNQNPNYTTNRKNGIRRRQNNSPTKNVGNASGKRRIVSARRNKQTNVRDQDIHTKTHTGQSQTNLNLDINMSRKPSKSRVNSLRQNANLVKCKKQLRYAVSTTLKVILHIVFAIIKVVVCVVVISTCLLLQIMVTSARHLCEMTNYDRTWFRIVDVARR